MCRFDLAAEITNLSPGDYEIWFYSYDVRVDSGPQLRAVLPVSVDGEDSPPGALTLVACSNSGCLGGTSEQTNPEPVPPLSWTMIKAYYH